MPVCGEEINHETWQQSVDQNGGVLADGDRGGAKEYIYGMGFDRSAYEKAVSRDIGEGGGEGSAGEGELAEVANEHDGRHVDGVLQHAAGDDRPRQPHQPLRLRRRRRRRREQRLMDGRAWLVVHRFDPRPALLARVRRGAVPAKTPARPPR